MYMLWLAENTVQAGNQISNTAVETAFASVVPVLAANTDSPYNGGRSFKIEAFGYYSCQATPGTLTLKVKLGSTVLAASASFALPSGGVTNQGWHLKAYMQIVSTGTSGKVAFQGEAWFNNGGTPIMVDLINIGTGTAGQITVNTQSAQSISATVTFSTASASNTITLTQLVVEEIG